MVADQSTRIGVVAHDGKRLRRAGLEALRDALADAGHADPPWYVVPRSKDAPPIVRTLIEDDGVNRLLVWGGDGSVRRCADTILREGYPDVAIGVLPAGTGNGLAASLDIPQDLSAALDIALHGEARPIDAGLANGQEHFLQRAGTGFDALVVRDADDTGLKGRFGRFGYVLAAIRNLRSSPADARVSVDGRPWFSGPTKCVIVGNVGGLLGGISAFADASPTDGRVNVGVVEATSSWELVRLLGRVITHRVRESRFARTTTASSVVIEFDRSVIWHVDGGDRAPTDRLEIRCLPAAISICQPRRTTQAPTTRG